MLSEFLQPVMDVVATVQANRIESAVLAAVLVWLQGDPGSDNVEERFWDGLGTSYHRGATFLQKAAPIALTMTSTVVGLLLSAAGEVLKALWGLLDALVEFEDAPIKVGPLLEVYGVRIGIASIGLLVLLSNDPFSSSILF